MAKTRAQLNRAIRQEELREQLKAQGHVQHVNDIADKLADLAGNDLDSVAVQRLKSAADIKLKLIDKYLPSLKSVENTGEGGGPVDFSLNVSFVKPNADQDS